MGHTTGELADSFHFLCLVKLLLQQFSLGKVPGNTEDTGRLVLFVAEEYRDDFGIYGADLTPLPLPLLKLQPPRNLIVAFLSFFHSKPVHLAGPRVPVAGSPAHCVA